MQTEYKATLKDGQVKWTTTAPPNSLNGVQVLVTVLPAQTSESERRERGAAMAAALRKLSKIKNGGLASIEDPVAWQREIRKDRPLPGRE